MRQVEVFPVSAGEPGEVNEEAADDDEVLGVVELEEEQLARLQLREWDDKSKFLAQAGFTLENPHLLLASIRSLAESAEAVQDGGNEYGEFLRADGELIGPTGRALPVVTIWLRWRLDGRVRFVTLKPRKETRT